MRIEILDEADDLIEGFHLYEAQRPISALILNLKINRIRL